MRKKYYHGYGLAGPDRGKNGCLFAGKIALLPLWIVEIYSTSQRILFSGLFLLFMEVVDVYLLSVESTGIFLAGCWIFIQIDLVLKQHAKRLQLFVGCNC